MKVSGKTSHTFQYCMQDGTMICGSRLKGVKSRARNYAVYGSRGVVCVPCGSTYSSSKPYEFLNDYSIFELLYVCNYRHGNVCYLSNSDIFTKGVESPFVVAMYNEFINRCAPIPIEEFYDTLRLGQRSSVLWVKSVWSYYSGE
jgi:hypothetical protein